MKKLLKTCKIKSAGYNRWWAKVEPMSCEVETPEDGKVIEDALHDFLK
jgi:hypothetical protein